MQDFATAAEVRKFVESLFSEAHHEADLEDIARDDSLFGENLVRETIAEIPVIGSALAYLTFVVEAFRHVDKDTVLKDVPETSPRALDIYEHVVGSLQHALWRMARNQEHPTKEAPDVIFITLQWRLFTGNRTFYAIAKPKEVAFKSGKCVKQHSNLGLSIGSHPKCDISIDDPALRSVHYRVQWVGAKQEWRPDDSWVLRVHALQKTGFSQSVLLLLSHASLLG